MFHAAVSHAGNEEKPNQHKSVLRESNFYISINQTAAHCRCSNSHSFLRHSVAIRSQP